MSDVSALYVSDEPVSIEVNGVTIKVREPTAEDYIKCQSAAIKMRRVGNDFLPDFDMGSFNKKLVELCVVEPKLDVKKLKGTVFRQIATKIQDIFGLVAEEDFLKK